MGTSQVVTQLSADEAVARLVPALTHHGATVTSTSNTEITGEVSTKRSPSVVIAIVLFLLAIIPGIIYLIVGGRRVVEPFSITIAPGPAGTTLVAAGQGRGEEAAQFAIKQCG